MANINQCVFTGNLVRDMELRYTKANTAIGKFSLAVNEARKVGDEWKEEGHFFDFVVWGRRAESLSKYLTKGTKVLVVARAMHQTWETEEGKRSRVEFKVQDLEFAGGKQSQGQSGGNSRPEAPAAPKEPSSDLDDDFEDDVPF